MAGPRRPTPQKSSWKLTGSSGQLLGQMCRKDAILQSYRDGVRAPFRPALDESTSLEHSIRDRTESPVLNMMRANGRPDGNGRFCCAPSSTSSGTFLLGISQPTPCLAAFHWTPQSSVSCAKKARNGWCGDFEPFPLPFHSRPGGAAWPVHPIVQWRRLQDAGTERKGCVCPCRESCFFANCQSGGLPLSHPRSRAE